MGKSFLSLLTVVLLFFGSVSSTLAQCVYTTVRDGNFFNDPGVFAITGAPTTGGGGCPAAPTSSSIVVINHRIILNGNFTVGNGGSLTISAAGSLVEDATSRTLTIDQGTFTVNAVANRGIPRLTVSRLVITRTNNGSAPPTVTIGANSAIQVTCLALGNQGGLTLNTNSLLNVFGNVDVSNGNGTILGAAAGTAPAGIRVLGIFTGVNGGTSNLFGVSGLLTCVQGTQGIATCPSTGGEQTPPNSNDPSCRNVLPVTLAGFTAKAQAQVVALKWATAMEKNNAYFEVQRSADSKTFTALDRVSGHGTTAIGASYSFLDRTPLAGLSYYRLRQVDTDGTEAFSSVVVVTGIDKLEAVFYPNPSNSSITLPATGTLVKYRIYSTTGQTVATGEAQGGADVDVQKVPAGLYFLELTSAGKQNVQRFVRQ